MDEHTLRILEYDKVIGLVARYAASDAGKASVRCTSPAPDSALVKERLRETEEFLTILQRGENPPLDGIPDVGPLVEKLSVPGITLSPADLLNVAILLGCGRRVKQFFQRLPVEGACPLLTIYADGIRILRHLEEAVYAVIDEQAEVKDSASPDLRRIRKQLVRVRDDVLNRLSRMLQDSGTQKVVQEAVITIREDRYVLPLKPGFRRNIKGVVLGQSGSHATVFVEPLDVVEQNNRLAELRMEEREEVERILRKLTGLLANEASAIGITVSALASIDAIHARARFGIEYDGIIPRIIPEQTIRIKSGRHPLLVRKRKEAGGSDVQPNDIELGEGQRALIISGPNAGGKTVILKTVGLLSLMAQAGLPVTAAEGSELPCFGSVYADIGDEQSIEQNLSTFSSHVSRIAGILRNARADSLVLLDELGSGTDPAEGGGLGASVLESLIERGCVTLVTTHHSALKLFGSKTENAVNAAMEFDDSMLTPTYRMISGRPGRSYGLDMAARHGMPEDVVERARARIGSDDLRLEALLTQMEKQARSLDAEKKNFDQERARIAWERGEASKALRLAREEARGILTRAQTDAREVLSSLRQKLRDLSRVQALPAAEAGKSGAEAQALAKKLESEELEQKSGAQPDFVMNLHAGDRVRISRLNKTGTVLSLHRDAIELDVAGKKVKLRAAEVLPAGISSRTETGASQGWGTALSEEDSVSDRLNIIGLRVEEGVAELDRFIDRAGIAGLSIITVIHGLGTGALRSAVTEFLRNHPLVASLRSGEPAEGGAGVTVVELKK